jgi:hypothetical protein
MLWDPLMRLRESRVAEEMGRMENDLNNGFVIVHLGVWIQKIWNNKTEIGMVKRDLEKRIVTLEKLTKPVIEPKHCTGYKIKIYMLFGCSETQP